MSLWDTEVANFESDHSYPLALSLPCCQEQRWGDARLALTSESRGVHSCTVEAHPGQETHCWAVPRPQGWVTTVEDVGVSLQDPNYLLKAYSADLGEDKQPGLPRRVGCPSVVWCEATWWYWRQQAAQGHSGQKRRDERSQQPHSPQGGPLTIFQA